jgi:hypothetical protein
MPHPPASYLQHWQHFLIFPTASIGLLLILFREQFNLVNTLASEQIFFRKPHFLKQKVFAEETTTI